MTNEHAERQNTEPVSKNLCKFVDNCAQQVHRYWIIASINSKSKEQYKMEARILLACYLHQSLVMDAKALQTNLCSASYIRWQCGTTRICLPLLLSAGRAAIDRYLLSCGPACCWWPMLGQTDEQTPCPHTTRYLPFQRRDCWLVFLLCSSFACSIHELCLYFLTIKLYF